MLIAGAVWVLLCLDRGLLQAHRNYRGLAANLLVEAAVRTVAMIGLVAAGFGVAGAALGVLVAELVTALHARLGPTGSGRSRSDAETVRDAEPAAAGAGRPPSALGPHLRGRPGPAGPAAQRREMVTDLVAALVALAMVALLQNIDVIVVGRDARAFSGSYAAVSVASKALVFGALVLGGYLLPEAAIRWRQGGHALRQLAVTLLLLAVPSVLLLVIALAAPRLLLSVVFSARYLGRRGGAAPARLGHGLPERHGDPHHVPAGRAAAAGSPPCSCSARWRPPWRSPPPTAGR